MSCRRVGLMAAMSVLGLTACSQSSNTSTPATIQTSNVAPSLWNPCESKDLPDDAITAAGLDPKSKEKGVVQFTTYHLCDWGGGWYLAEIGAGGIAYDHELNNDKYTDRENLAIGDRRAVRMRNNTIAGECDILFAIPGGSALFAVGPNLDAGTATSGHGDSCVEVTRVATALAKYLPSI
ncbi:DUF3558 domain-containing protein [Nocardia sp. NPDC052254]|uniref:DUF3558 domain-containing protein n=1 Tax=Nocardia sp. NPDC052254 TaxID=3155681 RepID=UPI00342565FF